MTGRAACAGNFASDFPVEPLLNENEPGLALRLRLHPDERGRAHSQGVRTYLQDTRTYLKR